MSVEADLEYAYGWNRYTMTFIGIWPENRSLTQPSSYRVIIPILMMLCFCCAPQSANLPFVWGDFDLVVENLATGNVTITISLVKAIIFWSNGGYLRTLLLNMTRDWNAVTDTQDRRKMLGIANITRKLSIRSTVLVFNVVMVFTVSRFVAIRQTGRELLLRAYFPYNATRSPSYELTFLGQFMGTMYAAATYTSVDTFIATLVLHTCGQLSNLRRELTNLCGYTKAEFQTKLSNIARKHEHLNRFAETIEDSFNMMLLIQMLGCSLQLCFQFLQAFTSIMDKMDEVFIFKIAFLTIYVVYVLIQLYLYCYIGEKLLVEGICGHIFILPLVTILRLMFPLESLLNLTFQSTKIAYAAYECSWYNLSAREARSLMIIMCRARSPLQISAGRFCSFNRELYSEVLKRSMAYISCIYAIN